MKKYRYTVPVTSCYACTIYAENEEDAYEKTDDIEFETINVETSDNKVALYINDEPDFANAFLEEIDEN